MFSLFCAWVIYYTCRFAPFLFPSGLQYQHGNPTKKSSETSIWHKHNFKFVDWRFRVRRCVSAVSLFLLFRMSDCMCICMCACLALFILQPHFVMQINLRGGYTHCFILHVGIDTKQTATDRKFCSYFSFGVMHVRYDHSRKKRRQRRTYVCTFTK